MASWLTRNSRSTPLPDWLETVVLHIPWRLKVPFNAVRRRLGPKKYDPRLDPNVTLTHNGGYLRADPPS